MEQIQDFDRLTVSDSPDETYEDEGETRTTADCTKFVSRPYEIKCDYDTINIDQLFAFNNNSNDFNHTQYNQLSLSSNQAIVHDIAEEQSNDENQTIANNDDEIVASEKYPQGSVKKYGLNQWSQHEEKPHLYIRNQSRNKTGRRDISECNIHIQDLPSGDPTINTDDGEWLLYHATSWKKARRITKLGIQDIDEHDYQDQAVGGAFYFNDSYFDCYDWLYTNNSSYRGEHAILVFKYNPWALSKSGEELTYNEWKDINQKRNSDKDAPDWSYTYQNSRPAEHWEQGKNPNARLRSDGTIAKQLIVRSQKMCDKIGPYCIACIFYEKMDDYSSIPAAEQSSTRQCRYSNDERKRKRQKSKVRSKARDSKRFHEE